MNVRELLLELSKHNLDSKVYFQPPDTLDVFHVDEVKVSDLQVEGDEDVQGVVLL